MKHCDESSGILISSSLTRPVGKYPLFKLVSHFAGSQHAIRRKAKRSLSESGASTHGIHSPDEEEEDDIIKEAMEGIHYSERMHRDLDEASMMMTMLTESLDAEFSKDVVVRRTRLGSNSKNRRGVRSSLTISEPGMYVCMTMYSGAYFMCRALLGGRGGGLVMVMPPHG